MPKVEFFLGQPKQVEFEAKRPMIVEESKVQSNYTENDPQAPSHILNRPFYSETVTEPLEITWDGAWGGRPYIVLQQQGFEGICLVKVSDEFFDAEQLRSGYVTIGGGRDETIPISELSIQTLRIGNAITHAVMLYTIILLFSVSESVNVDGIQAEKGIYFLSRSFMEDGNNEIYRAYVSTLSFPSVTYTKYYKLDNNFVDAEWMATESTGVGTKKFSLVNFYDALIVGGIYASMPIVQLDSRPYTEEELNGARLTFDIKNVPFAWTVVNTVTIDNALVATMFCIEGDAYFCLISMEEDGILDEFPLKKGLYILTDVATDFSQVSNITLEIFNATGQTIPNKLPNKFLDLDWVPKAETKQEVLYEGAVSGESVILLQNEPQLLDLDTVLLFHVGDDVREVRGGGVALPIGMVVYPYALPNGEYIMVQASTEGTRMEYSVESGTYVSITLLKRVPNPIPSYFLPALNSTLTEGSTLPAQEGAVFTAIQGLQDTIGTLNQDLENRLNGGT